MLLTRSPLSPGPKPWFSLDLHVLSAPPAFVLSQDQTLREDLSAAEAANLPLSLSSKSVPRGVACDAAKEVDRLCRATTPSGRDRVYCLAGTTCLLGLDVNARC